MLNGEINTATRGQSSVSLNGIFGYGTISAVDKTREIDKTITELTELFKPIQTFENLVYLAKNQTIKHLQEHLQEFLSNDTFKNTEKFWEGVTGINYLNDDVIDEESLPRNIVNVQIKKDTQSLPLRVFISFSDGSFCKNRLDINLPPLLEQFKSVKDKNLDYLRPESLRQMQSDVKSLSKKFRLMQTSNEEKFTLIQHFNQTWKDKFELTYTQASSKGKIIVTDPLKLVRIKNKFTYLSPLGKYCKKINTLQNRLENSSVQNKQTSSRSSIWNFRKVRIALTLGIIVIAVSIHQFYNTTRSNNL